MFVIIDVLFKGIMALLMVGKEECYDLVCSVCSAVCAYLQWMHIETVGCP